VSRGGRRNARAHAKGTARLAPPRGRRACAEQAHPPEELLPRAPRAGPPLQRVRRAGVGLSRLSFRPDNRIGKGTTMRNLVPQRSGNPVLRGNTFEGLSTTGERMWRDGTVNWWYTVVAILFAGA